MGQLPSTTPPVQFPGLIGTTSLVKNIQKRTSILRGSTFVGARRRMRSSMLRAGCRISEAPACKSETWRQHWSGDDLTTTEYKSVLNTFDECCSLSGVSITVTS